MKRIINIKFLTALAVLFVVASSCTKDFETINTDPNNPSTELAAPDMLLTNIIESATDRTHEMFLGHEMGNCWVQHMAKVQYTDEDRYIFRAGVVNNTWSSFYASSGMDITTLYKVADARKNDNYKGIAMVMKVYVTSMLTDLFGDVPYTEAWRAGVADGGIVSPKYDTQASIYHDIVKKLDTANTLLDPAGKEIGGDILFGGDIAKWKMFANSMRLRLLLRMQAKDVAYVTAEMTKMVADPAKYPVFESNDDNAQLVYLGSAPNNNPINENRKTRDDHRVSATIIDIQWTNNPNMDYRVTVYANLPSAHPTGWVGLPNGLTSSKALAYKGNGLTQTSKIGNYFTAASCPGVLMSYAELQFILAEGVERNLITGAPKTAEEYYTAGIFGSYNQYADDIVANTESLMGITATIDELADDYMVNGGAGWDSENALEIIATERWLATFEQGLQSWFEWRRTGFPVLVPAEDGANAGKIPVRVPYPTDDVATNPANYKAAVATQGADDLNTRVWWNK